MMDGAWRNGKYILFSTMEDRCARLERELAECKEDAKDWKNRYEGMAILHANKVRMIENGDLVRRVNISKIEAECDALAAQVVQMKDALESAWSDGYAFSRDKVQAALALDTKPAQEIVNAVKAQALREAAEQTNDGYVTGLTLHRMADELEKK
jgi:uncharacterized surface protein with fasciclin (FAS1) repeats